MALVHQVVLKPSPRSCPVNPAGLSREASHLQRCWDLIGLCSYSINCTPQELVSLRLAYLSVRPQALPHYALERLHTQQMASSLPMFLQVEEKER